MGSVRGARGDFVDSLGVLLSQGVRNRRRICWAGQIFGERLAQPRVDEVDLACTLDPSHGTPVVLDVCSCRFVCMDRARLVGSEGLGARSPVVLGGAHRNQRFSKKGAFKRILVEVLVSMTHRSKIGRVFKHSLTGRVTVCG